MPFTITLLPSAVEVGRRVISKVERVKKHSYSSVRKCRYHQAPMVPSCTQTLPLIAWFSFTGKRGLCFSQCMLRSYPSNCSSYQLVLFFPCFAQIQLERVRRLQFLDTYYARSIIFFFMKTRYVAVSNFSLLQIVSKRRNPFFPELFSLSSCSFLLVVLLSIN